MTKLKVTQSQLKDALNQSHGMITGAAELLGVARLTIYKYLDKWPDAKEEIDRWKVRRKDRAEYKLDEAIDRGESWAIMFCLKNAKDREYQDKVSFDDDSKLTVVVRYEHQPINDSDAGLTPGATADPEQPAEV